MNGKEKASNIGEQSKRRIREKKRKHNNKAKVKIKNTRAKSPEQNHVSKKQWQKILHQ